MRHSKEELQIINNYKKSVDLEVRNFVEKDRNYIVSAFIKPADRKSDSSVPNNAYALGKRPKRS